MDTDLDDLYRVHPDQFVAARNELVKELRSAGARDEADRVKKLRRPTTAAWLVNRVALTSPELLEEFADARHELGEAQQRALEGNDDAAAEWRGAASRERDALAAIVEAAADGAKNAGHQPTDRALELVGDTLRTASGDADLLDAVVRGRLEREQTGASLGTLELEPPDPAERRRRRSRDAKKQRESERGEARAKARREAKRLDAELESAEKREERIRRQVEQASEALKERKAELAESKRETAALRRKLKSAEKRAVAMRRP